MAYSGLKLTSTQDNSSIAYTMYGWLPDVHIQTSIDGEVWEDWDGTAISLNTSEFRYIRNTANTLSTDSSKYIRFVMTGKIVANGDISSMINFGSITSYCYYRMFDNCKSLTQAPELPATALASYCYYSMFYGTSLITAPELPATTLAEDCYEMMFDNCKSLTTAPELPATVLPGYCYRQMFYNCTSLTQVPELLATTLADRCYAYMFSGCTSLTQVPELPATELAEACYQGIFDGCTSLTEAPELPATTLMDYCYNYMFRGCTSLIEAPELPATALTRYSCYKGMFEGCTSLKVNENEGGIKIFTCPSTTGLNEPVTDMFKNTGGTFKGTPRTGNTYYYEGVPPVSYNKIHFNGKKYHVYNRLIKRK